MVYQPKTGASKEINKLMADLSTAQFQWNTYATQLGRGYTAAYQEHEDAIKKINEQYRLAAEAAYWVLSLLCVSAAGGVAGGLMAPWATRAGLVAARTTVSETIQSMTGQIAQKGLDATKPAEAGFKPVVKSPLLYFQDMLGEIGICFSALRDELEAWMKSVDEDTWPANPSDGINKFLQAPIIKDYPRTKDMPNEKKLAREAEIGMWIAWANVRDIDYWKTRIDTVSDKWAGRRTKGLHMDDLRKLQPVVDRLRTLEAAALGTRTVEKPMVVGSMKETFLDITRLRLPVPGGGDFLAKVADVVKIPRKVLPELAQLPPSYKRAS